MHVPKVNLSEVFLRFDDYWNPKIIGEVNNFHVKLVKVEGEFVWHHHESEDELFLVVKGQLTIQLRDGELVLDEGELAIVPRGVEHRPLAREETHLLVFEPGTTRNTGNVIDERTVENPDRL
jgi:mannose-6-phosphate isomerase-like protein (cupin superfamily)